MIVSSLRVLLLVLLLVASSFLGVPVVTATASSTSCSSAAFLVGPRRSPLISGEKTACCYPGVYKLETARATQKPLFFRPKRRTSSSSSLSARRRANDSENDNAEAPSKFDPIPSNDAPTTSSSSSSSLPRVSSLEALALAVSLFFLVTVAVFSGSLFATAPTETTTRTIIDPELLLQQDFMRVEQDVHVE